MIAPAPCGAPIVVGSAVGSIAGCLEHRFLADEGNGLDLPGAAHLVDLHRASCGSAAQRFADKLVDQGNGLALQPHGFLAARRDLAHLDHFLADQRGDLEPFHVGLFVAPAGLEHVANFKPAAARQALGPLGSAISLACLGVGEKLGNGLFALAIAAEAVAPQRLVCLAGEGHCVGATIALIEVGHSRAGLCGDLASASGDVEFAGECVAHGAALLSEQAGLADDVEQREAVDRVSSAGHRAQRCRGAQLDQLALARCISGGLDRLHRSSLPQDLSALEQLDQAPGPGFGFAVLATLLIGDCFGQCLGNRTAIYGHVNGPFSTLGAARAVAFICADKPAQYIVSSKKFHHAQHTDFCRVKTERCRNHHRAIAALFAHLQTARCAIAQPVQPRPDAITWRGRALVRFALPLPRPVACANKLARQLLGCDRVGGAVLAGTATEPRRNRQTTVFAPFFARFCGFLLGASRVMRVRTRVSARTCRGLVKRRTVEPNNNTYIYQEVDGSIAVPHRFPPEPGRVHSFESGGFLRFSNILPAGYAAPVAQPGRSELRSAVQGARAGETFGVSAAGGAAELVDLVAIGLDADQIRRAARNGGFLRVSATPRGPVGRVMLEGWPQRRANASFVGIVRKPVGLARLDLGALVGAGLDQAAPADRPAGPPRAPIRAGLSPEPAAALPCRDLDRLRPSTIRGMGSTGAGWRQTLTGPIGSGLGLGWSAAMGRGELAGWSAVRPCGLRRAIDHMGEASRVN